MFKVIATNVVVSKGYGENPTFKFSEDKSIVNFRIGKKVYDSRAEDNSRWINLTVKAFGDVCERIKKMKLKDGSYLNIEGKLDEDVWEDDGETKRRIVIVLTDVEYASSGSGSNKTEDDSETEKKTDKKSGDGKKPQDSDNFTGFSNFGGGENPFL